MDSGLETFASVTTPADASAGPAAYLPSPFVARLKTVTESPEMVSIRATLPYGFAGLAAGIVAFMAMRPAGTLLERFSASFAPAFGVMSVLLAIAMTVDLARRRRVPVAGAVLASGVAFTICLPIRASFSAFDVLAALGSSGLFVAIGVALLSVSVVRLACSHLGRLSGSFAGIGMMAGSATALMACGLSPIAELDRLIAPLGHLGDSLAALLMLTFVETMLWTIGIHGPALLAAVVLPVYVKLQVENTAALAHGAALPHLVTVSTFLFVFPGGAGATFPLVLLLLRSRVRRVRAVAYATLVPALLNANEPLMFGLPMVLNPLLAAPFVLVPLALAALTYAAMSLGLVARPAYYVPSTLPLPLNVFLATRDWRSLVLIALNLVVGTALYAPFVAMYERHESEREEAADAAA
jgi:cellobiose PTS system EIIC component